MKLFLALALAAVSVFGQSAEVKNVYILPMSGGLDQFLAISLSQDRVLQVVTDPQKADLIITDRIGSDFEDTLDNMYGSVEPQPADSTLTFARPNMRPLSTNRGTVFLVDRNSRNVLWSTFEQPRGSDAKEMNRTASTIVDRLAKSLKPE